MMGNASSSHANTLTATGEEAVGPNSDKDHQRLPEAQSAPEDATAREQPASTFGTGHPAVPRTPLVKHMDPSDSKRLSDQLVRLVQVVFALVLGQSLVVFKVVLLDPVTHWLAAFAWSSVFYTTVASWIDWHVVMAHRPYDTRQLLDRLRIYSDVIIAIIYAYLLFTIEPLIDTPRATLAYHLVGYPLVFGFYLASGLLRRRVHGKRASKPLPMIYACVAYAALWYAYVAVRTATWLDMTVLNGIAIGMAVVLMFGYRIYRRRLAHREELSKLRLFIGVDVDGVLADQVTSVLPIVKERHDVSLVYEDITHWQLPIKDSDIAQEIRYAQKHRDYVVGMGVHEGARSILKFVRKLHRVIVITARSGDAAVPWTTEWLRNNNLPYDEVVASGESQKSQHHTDVLIDDFIGNIREFLSNTKGVAVLVDQPWNRDRQELNKTFGSSQRLFVVSGLLQLRRSWQRIESAARAAKDDGTGASHSTV